MRFLTTSSRCLPLAPTRPPTFVGGRLFAKYIILSGALDGFTNARAAELGALLTTTFSATLSTSSTRS